MDRNHISGIGSLEHAEIAMAIKMYVGQEFIRDDRYTHIDEQHQQKSTRYTPVPAEEGVDVQEAMEASGRMIDLGLF